MTIGGAVPVGALRNRVDAGFAAAVADLVDLVGIPGIAWPAFDSRQLDRSAETVAGLLRAAGIGDVRIVRGAGQNGKPGGPAVLARKPAAEGCPTVLLYAHHDVQPPGEPELWSAPAFTAVEREGRLWGRGVADDKAGIIMHLAAYRALTEVLGTGFGLGVTFFIEGEEESGSPTLDDLLQTHMELLRADVIIIADSGNRQVGVPALTTSLRGLVDGFIEVEAFGHGLHSGTFSGPVLDAVTLLARLIATFHDGDGTVAIRGLPVADEPVDPAAGIGEAEFRAQASLPSALRLAGTGSIASRLWNGPALSIIGLDAPGTAVASNTLLPSARAKFSLRLAPGTDPARAMEAVRRHVMANVPFGAEVRFFPGSMSAPFSAASDGEASRIALWAMGQAWGVAPVRMGVGGSIPVVEHLAGRFPDSQILITGAEDPDSRAHGPDESVHLGDLRNAILAEALMLAALDRRT
ncbi:M20/M25/M40 family metallo-hydrolase [Arthrobacter sp. YAF34]|uniref:M20/M25/M40 family metallo-hydrolase n=1 Tax=Arthrobacter sp. YAF34 TaxID=3233083 RepID=UPI003F9255D9